jgi:hypothetical protein
MHTYEVTVNGHIHVIRANSFQRPDESLSGKWVFTNAQGKAVWDFDANTVTAIRESLTFTAVGAGRLVSA